MAKKVNDKTFRPKRRFLANVLFGSMSTAAFLSPAIANAQDSGDFLLEEVVVTALRRSLERSVDIKRDSHGVVDAISTEDMGKLPDSNLAESLQRISGVSIDRVNGEGARVTVRGFGSGFNLITLNGRVMPTADVSVVGSGSGGGAAAGTSRSFDFSNVAAEGVSGLKVYKTGNALLPTGGIGATIDVETHRPLENPGFHASFGTKALFDTSVERGDKTTPELSGLLSWTDDDGKFGVSVFGSYQERNSAAPGAASNNWNIEPYSAFSDTANGRVSATTIITNPPSPDTLVSYPNDSRLDFSESERERLNGQVVLQFKPSDALVLTADATYYKNESTEQRQETTSWFARPFLEVVFDGNPVVSTATFLSEDLAGAKDISFGQDYRATEDTLESFGFNADWRINDRFSLIVDGHTSSAESNPNNPLGHTSTTVSFGSNVLAFQSVDYSNDIPVRVLDFDDTIDAKLPGEFFGTNGNGVLDLADLGSSIARTSTSRQQQDVDELLAIGNFDINDDSRFSLGVNYRQTKMEQQRQQNTQTLGDWGIVNPGDIQLYAPGLVEQYCLGCLFDDYNPGGGGDISFRGDATKLYNLLSAEYASQGNAVGLSRDENNIVEEDMLAVFGQFTMEGELNGRPVNLSVGVRWEDTDVKAGASFSTPQTIIWLADNDFLQTVSDDNQTVEDSGSYNNLLPSMDFSMEIIDDLVGRVSFGKTLARADYGNLFVADSTSNPLRPTAVGGIVTGTTGNTGLLPLVSNNFDVSLEYYFGKASYASIGYFEKRVQNFVGTGQSTKSLFGLRDATSGQPGTRSGDALSELSVLGLDPTDVNLFTMTALIDTLGSVEAATTEFQANLVDGVLDQNFINTTYSAIDITANDTDPLFQFEVTGPINNREGTIDGVELAFQHFFGDTGFGLQANYTIVNGDVSINVGADPSVDQFALLGLSDSANVTFIYENSDLSARIAYNWRDTFLAETNVGGGNRNPRFVEAYGQLDMNVTYIISEGFAVSLEGINLTGENTRSYGRSTSNLWFAQENEPRYLLGARYSF